MMWLSAGNKALLLVVGMSICSATRLDGSDFNVIPYQVDRTDLYSGLAGTILVYKIASALSSSGASLDACESLALYINSRLGTIGIGLDHCHVPGTSAHDSHLGANQFELGMGIHNEAGTSKHELTTVAELVDQMLTKITDTQDEERSFVPFKHDGQDEVVLLVNDLGAVSQLELGGIVSECRSSRLDHIQISGAEKRLDTMMHIQAKADNDSSRVARQQKHQGPPRSQRDVHDLAQHARLLPHPASLA
jgi:hypothetical protein